MNFPTSSGGYRNIAAVVAMALLIAAFTEMHANPAPCRFTVLSTENVGCEVVFTYPGAVQMFVVGPGSGAQYGGYCTPVFLILDCHGNEIRVDARMSCVRNIPITPDCCVDACITFDVQGNPVLNIQPASNPRECVCLHG